MTVRVYKARLLSALGHDHEIAAPIAGGTVDATARQVELHANAAALQVRDPKISDKDSAEIRSTILGPAVLDSRRFPEIVFRSTAAEPAGPGSWRVQGNLTLHGETRLVDVAVRETGGHYVGTAHFKQSEFDIKPVKVAGGSIRVRDDVRIEFDIQVAH
jgi:polyisoprenoid-binding protein YceI